MAYNKHWAEVPFTMFLSLEGVGHLLLTCLVFMLSYGSFLSLQFSAHEEKFTNISMMIERLYALFLGDLSVAYGFVDLAEGHVAGAVFSLLYLL